MDGTGGHNMEQSTALHLNWVFGIFGLVFLYSAIVNIKCYFRGGFEEFPNYFSCRERWGKLGGFIATIRYIWLPAVFATIIFVLIIYKIPILNLYELWRLGNRRGYHEFTFDNGNQYKGEWLNNEMHGKGTFLYVDGTRYTGDFKHDMFDGNGVYSNSDGSTYVGQFSKGMASGYGEQFHSDGTIDKGYFFENEYIGSSKPVDFQRVEEPESGSFDYSRLWMGVVFIVLWLYLLLICPKILFQKKFSGLEQIIMQHIDSLKLENAQIVHKEMYELLNKKIKCRDNLYWYRYEIFSHCLDFEKNKDIGVVERLLELPSKIENSKYWKLKTTSFGLKTGHIIPCKFLITTVYLAAARMLIELKLIDEAKMNFSEAESNSILISKALFIDWKKLASSLISDFQNKHSLLLV